MASMASLAEVWAVIMITGVLGFSAFVLRSRSSPLPSGILMSQRIRSGEERMADADPSA